MQLTPQLTANACSRYEGGDLVKAEHLCRQALDQNPSDPAALHLLGLIALRLSKQEEALDACR